MGTYDYLKSVCTGEDDAPYDCRWYAICQRYPGVAFCGHSLGERVAKRAKCLFLDKIWDFYRSQRPWEA